MKAIIQDRYRGPEHLRLADIPVPEPVRSQIRVRVLACAVNLSDREYLIGSPFYARLVGGLMRPKHPVLGSDIVGIVDKLGPNTSGFSIGDRVMGDLVMVRGGFAQYACVSVAEMVRVPDGLSDEIAACLPHFGHGRHARPGQDRPSPSSPGPDFGRQTAGQTVRRHLPPKANRSYGRIELLQDDYRVFDGPETPTDPQRD